MKKRCVVFAYHDVGVRCLRVLLAQGLAQGLEIGLVVTHTNAPGETIWFESVEQLAREYGLPVLTPDQPNSEALYQKIAELSPDFIFSFYYRHMLPARLLSLAKEGAFNMHGSLLPKYRGRVPVNWAVLYGEQETGATLHEMTVKPDAGAIIAQTAVPILPDDTAHEVFKKVTVAAEQTLWQALPGLIDGTVSRRPNDVSRGSYFGGRKPEDGRIDWTCPAQQVYNLIRAVAPPYPGAFTELAQHRVTVARARLLSTSFQNLPLGLQLIDNRLIGICGDKHGILIHELNLDGVAISPEAFSQLLQLSE